MRTVAVVAMFDANTPCKGIPFQLVLNGKEYIEITNADGYAAFPAIPENVTGTLKLAAGVVQYYEQPITLASGNQSIRCGNFNANPQDLILPAPSPFKKPLPKVPTREAVCNGQLTAQAVTIHSLTYGDMPWWPACWAWLTKADRAHIAPQLLALGDTIMLIDTPSGVPLYDEGGQFYSPDKFGPLPFDVPALKDLVTETLGYGFAGCWVFLGGDASYDIACAQVEAIAPAFGSLNQYVLYVPGWDGTWHKPDANGTGYTPQQVNSFAERARASGALYLGFEHGTGYAPVGEGGGDFKPGGNMSLYDAVLGEFNSGEWSSDVWQLLSRFTRDYVWPGYQQPTTGPAADLPRPSPFYPVDGVRGPVYYHIFEWAMYVAVRGESNDVMQQWKAAFRSMTASTRIC
jgi:hypothetical protein